MGDAENTPAQLKPQQWLPWAIIGGIFVAGIVIFALKIASKPPSPLPRSSRDSGFPLYYPSPVPAGYAYQAGSYKVSNHIAIFALKNDTREVHIAEQALPQPMPDFSKISALKPTDSLAGKIFSGTNAGQPIAIVQTNTTLITITGAPGMPSDVVTSLAQSLRSLPR